jgi:thiamine kinase-like enzyme
MAGSTTIEVPLVAMADLVPTQRYRLVLFNETGSHLLLQDRDLLPEMSIPSFTRPAEEITSRLKDVWGLPAVVLWTQPIATDVNHYYAVLEGCKLDWRIRQGLDWVAIQTAATCLNEVQAKAVEECHAKALKLPMCVDSEPFSRLGWIYGVQEWIEDVITPRAITGFSQLGGSENTAIVRFETTESPVWFKAVGEADPQEFQTTQILSTLFPKYLPRILAFDGSRKAWLMENGGQSLRHYQHLDAWKTVAQRLSALQIESLSRTSDLLEAGCCDMRSTTLLSLVDSFFEVMHDLMKRQTKSPPRPLEKRELFELEASLREALNELSALGIPDALGHSDFNPGNILITPDRCVFIDWSAAHVGNPFLTLEYLLAHRRRTCPAPQGEGQDLREVYAQCWLTRLQPEQTARALQLTPMVAVYASAISTNSWRDPQRLSRPEISGYLRSLGRIMKRESDSDGRGGFIA